MSARVRRYAVALVVVVLMIVVAASQRQSETPRHLFRITFGYKDKKATNWSGKIEISDGQIASITGWHFEEQDAVDGVRGWKCRTHVNIALGERFRHDVVRDGEVVHTHRPYKGGEEAKFHWEDAAPKRDEKASYYYVRVVQKDGQMAWASPIWVRK